MKGLVITEMEVIGFTSYTHQIFNWYQKGLNIIQAPNGSGKSKLINALVWCLYGKTLSGSITPWKMVQRDNFKGTMVRVSFLKDGVEYDITRCKDFKGKIEGAKGGDRLVIRKSLVVLSDKGKNDQQKFIEELLGYSLELFKNSIIFGQKLKKLINETGPNKKKVLDEAFEIAYLAKAKKLSEEKLTKVKLEIYKTEPYIETLKNRIINDEKVLNQLILEEDNRQENNKKLREDLEKSIKSYKEQIEEITSSIDNIINLKLRKNKSQKTVKTLENRVSEAEKLNTDQEFATRIIISGCKKSITNLTDKITELTNSLDNIPKDCPRCSKPFTKQELVHEKKRVLVEISDNKKLLIKEKATLNNANEKLSNLSNEYASLNKTKAVIDTLKLKINALDNLLINLEEGKKNLPKLKKELFEKEVLLHDLDKSSGKNNILEMQEQLADLKKELKGKEIPYIKLKRERKILQWLINDPLSNSGIKAFIFDSMLENINQRLNYYSSYIGFNVAFSVNLDSKNKDIDTFIIKQDEILPYEDLSGGQQQAVDIITIFAIHDVVTSNKICNLLIMDEIFEGLDANNIELTTELIQDKAKDKSLFLVTHRQEFIPTHSNIIRINYKNGISSIAS